MRLSLADTVMVGQASRSVVPVSKSSVPGRRGARGLVFAAGVTALAGTGAWSLARHPVRETAAAGPNVLVPKQSDALPIGSTTAEANADAPSASAVQDLRLKVAPPNADISVDGVSMAIQDGSVLVRGTVGSVHTVRIAHAGRTNVRRVAITNDGLIPGELGLDSKSTVGGRTAERSHTDTVLTTHEGVAVSPGAAGAASLPALSDKFE